VAGPATLRAPDRPLRRLSPQESAQIANEGLGKGEESAMVRAGIALAPPTCRSIWRRRAFRMSPFYQGRDFAVTAEWTIPNGPRFWSMTRPPGQAVA